MKQERHRCAARLRMFPAALAMLALAMGGCGFGSATIAGAAGGGGGGGRSGSTAESLAPVLSIGGAKPMPGQVMAVDVVNAARLSLSTATPYQAVWKDQSGAIARGVTVSAITPQRLALVVPVGIPGGSYEFEVVVGSAIARAVVVVDDWDPASLPDAASYLTSVRSLWASMRDALSVRAVADPDSERRSRSLADLSTLESWLSVFAGGLPGLDAGEVGVLAQVLKVNEQLRAAELPVPADPYYLLDPVAARCAAAGSMADVGTVALGAGESVSLPLGASETLPVLVAASVKISGLIGTLTAFDRWRGALESGVKPIPGSLVVTPAAPLVLSWGMPSLGLACRASCRSLVESDAGLADERIVEIFAGLDRRYSMEQALGGAVTGNLRSRAPKVLTSGLVTTFDLTSSQYRLEGHAPAGVGWTLGLTSGRLGFSQSPSQHAQSGETIASLRFLEDPNIPLWTTDEEVQVVVDCTLGVANLVAIPPGTFLMGSNPPRPPSEQPAHQVTITRPFWMGKYEVTQAEYRAVMSSNPSQFVGDNRPVELVTWSNAVAYCDQLSVREAAAGRLPPGYEYRLPTEAEWEYCCRAGTSGSYSFGETCTLHSSGGLCYCMNYSSGCVVGGTIEVGGSSATGGAPPPPNAFGLHDMHGNVSEWCLDIRLVANGYGSGGAESDPYYTTANVLLQTVRGGNWEDGAEVCRSAYRGNFPGVSSNPPSANRVGFRIVLAPELP